MNGRRLDDHIGGRRSSAQRSSARSVQSASSSGVTFSETQLGRLLASEGMCINQDFEVPVQSATIGGRRRSSDEKSVQSSGSGVSFSQTALGQALASQGMTATRDFEVAHVAPMPVKKNLVKKVMKSTARSRRFSDNQRHTNRIDKDEILFSTEELNQKLEIEFGGVNPGIVLIDDSENHEVDGAECFQDEEPFSGDDLFLGEFGAPAYRDEPSAHCRRTGYRDHVASSSIPYADNFSMQSTRSVPWPEEKSTEDPYRVNLQPCEISDLSGHKKTTSRRRLWTWCCFLLVGAVIGPLVLLSRIKNEDKLPKASAGASMGSGQTVEATPTAPEQVTPQPLRPTVDAATTPGTILLSAATAQTPEAASEAASDLPAVHYEDDPRFFHDWSGALLDVPVVNYALHPVRENTKLIITVGAPTGAGEPVRIHVFYNADADKVPGDVGCGEYAVQTVDAGAVTSLRIDAFHTTQIVACVHDTVVGTATHLFVDDWDGQEKTYDLQVLDFYQPGKNVNLISTKALSTNDVDHAYLIIKTPELDQLAYFLPGVESKEAQQIVSQPNAVISCQWQNSAEIRITHVAPLSPRLLLWDLTTMVPNDEQYWSALIWVCSNQHDHVAMSKPVGSVAVETSLVDPSETSGSTVWSVGPTHETTTP